MVILGTWINYFVFPAQAQEIPSFWFLEANGGHIWVQGDQGKFSELYQKEKGFNGGLENLAIQKQIRPELNLDLYLRALYPRDYRIDAKLEQKEVGYFYLRSHGFRTFDDPSGRVVPFTTLSSYEKDSSHTDRTLCDIGLGLTPKNWPKFNLRYLHQERGGMVELLHSGYVQEGLQKIKAYPSREDIDRTQNNLYSLAEYSWKDLSISLAHQYEDFAERSSWSNIHLKNDRVYHKETTTIERPQSRYSSTNINLAYSPSPKYRIGGGYCFNHVESTQIVDFIHYGPDYSLPTLPMTLWEAVRCGENHGDMDSHMGTLHIFVHPLSFLTLSAMAKVNAVDKDAHSLYSIDGSEDGTEMADGEVDKIMMAKGQVDELNFTQGVKGTLSLVPGISVSAEGHWEQDEIDYREHEFDILSPYLDNRRRLTYADIDRCSYRIEAPIQPMKNLQMKPFYHYRKTQTQYDHKVDTIDWREHIGPPGYFENWERNQEKYGAKLKWRWRRAAVTASYLHQTIDYVFLQQTHSEIASRRSRIGSIGLDLFSKPLKAGLCYSLEDTYTSTSTSLAQHDIPFYDGDFQSLLATTTFNLKEWLSFIFNGHFLWTQGLVHQRQQDFSFELEGKFSKNIKCGLRYDHYEYEDPEVKGVDDYRANGIYLVIKKR